MRKLEHHQQWSHRCPNVSESLFIQIYSILGSLRIFFNHFSKPTIKAGQKARQISDVCFVLTQHELNPADLLMKHLGGTESSPIKNEETIK